MSRDWTPRERLAAERYQIENGLGSIWDFLESLVLDINGESKRVFSDEGIALRKQFPVLGKLISNTGEYNFSSLYERLSKIDGGIELLHLKDDELADYIKFDIGNEDSALIKWFNGELDPNFYYREHNDELFGTALIEEAMVCSSMDKFVVMPLSESFANDVEELDKISGNSVACMLDCDDYAWGLFKNQKLIGYCTIGGADELFEDDFVYPDANDDSLLLSEVFVVPEYRGQGGAQFMVNEAIKKRTENEKELVFLTLLDNDLRHLYEKCGFEFVKDNIMVRDERVKSIDKVVSKAKERWETTDNKNIQDNKLGKETEEEIVL